MMDLSKISPAPWGEHVVTGDVRHYSVPGDGQRQNSTKSWATGPCARTRLHAEADAEFIALARNAFDIQLRTGWHAEYCATSWQLGRDIVELEIPDALLDKFFEAEKAFRSDNPFSVIVEADQWYRENVEAKP